jgi:NADPH-dependent 2,4-dienoyl-CoA reductase/sulfur reductase-like enzyme
MEVKHLEETDIAIVGAGPAGLTASIEAAKAGARTTLIDENSRPGGQLFKQIHRFFGAKDYYAGMRGYEIGERLLKETEERGVDVRLRAVAFGIYGQEVGLLASERVTTLRAKRIILATGAYENSLVFPGWTLPGVMGAGAVQTMVNVHRVLPGKNVLMIGSGNVGLIVSYQLLQAGAEVVAIVEALPKIGGYGVHAAKIRRARVPIMTSHTILGADGKNQVENAVVCGIDEKGRVLKGSRKVLDADLICIAVGLTPLSELAWMAGCRFMYVTELGGSTPIHNREMKTTLNHVYAAGDIAGVEEAGTAIEEGRMAGISASQSLGLIPDEVAEGFKRETENRLLQLRGGPFFKGRLQAKERLINAWNEK